MGWNISIKTEKDVSENVIEEVIEDLPETMNLGFGKQKWGWSLSVDLRLISPREIFLSGSYGASGNISETFAEAFARRLEKRGIDCKVVSRT